MRGQVGQPLALPKLIEKSVIIHKDENGFGLRIKGQTPVYIEHVHEGGAAWRAGVRNFDSICKVNGVPVSQMDHKDVVLMFKSCSRFVALTLVSPEHLLEAGSSKQNLAEQVELVASLVGSHQRQYSIYSHHGVEERPAAGQPSCEDASSLFAPNDYALDTSSSLLVDRTRSCRSRGALHAHQARASSVLLHPALGQLLHAGQSSAKLNRRDSSEDKSRASQEKRVAVCACCQQQQCCGANAAGHTHLIERQLNESPRQPLTPTQSCDTGKLEQTLAGRHMAGAQPEEQCERVHDKSAKRAQRPPASGSAHEAHSEARDRAERTQAAERLVQHVGPASKPKAVINKRIEIIRELIDTERTHTERLRCLDELFYRPIKQAGLMTAEQLAAVFACHRTLYKLHRQIYRILLSANFDIYSEPLVGSALLEIFEGDLKRRLERAACSFCSAQATNVELLNKLTRRDTKVGEFLAQVTSQRMIGRLGIKDLLASCFQRLTKYPLLLENLLRATPQISASEDNEPHQAHEQRANGPLESARFLGSPSGRNRAPLEAGRAKGGHQSISHEAGSTNGAQNEQQAKCYEEQRDDQDEDEDEEEAAARRDAAEEARRNSRRMLAISLAEEREFVERALVQSRHVLVRVNESIRVAMSRNKLREIWKRTDKYPGVPLIDISKQQVVHDGLLTLRLSRRSFDVYVLLLNDYIIILTREGQDKYRLKFFTPEGKSAAGVGGTAGGAGAGLIGTHAQGASSAAAQCAAGALQPNLPPHQTVYSPVFVIDEHLTTRDAATDENGFYLLCKRKDDSRIYEFASRSPAERMLWRDKIQCTIERQMSRNKRRASNCASTITKSSSETSANGLAGAEPAGSKSTGTAHDLSSSSSTSTSSSSNNQSAHHKQPATAKQPDEPSTPVHHSRSSSRTGCEPTKIVGTISYVVDDGIVMPNKMESSRVLVDRAIQVNILDGSKVSAARGQENEASSCTKLHAATLGAK